MAKPTKEAKKPYTGHTTGNAKVTGEATIGAAAERKAASTAQKQATEQKLQPMAKEINHRFEEALKLDGKADDHRLAAALRIADAKKLCEGNGVNFKKWVEANVVGQTYETVRKLATVGISGDPAKAAIALSDMRGKNKSANKAHRDKKKSEAKGNQGPKMTPFKAADEALSKLDDKTTLSLLQGKAKKMGMAVVSETTAKNAAKSSGATVDYDGMVESFKALKPGEKVQFLTWAAGDIGYRLTSLLEAPADAGEMPDFLKRKTAEGVPATGEAAGRRVRRGSR